MFKPLKRMVFQVHVTALIVISIRIHAESCDPISTFLGDQVPSREWYCSPEGSDSLGDGSRSNPFRGITRAAQSVQPGEAIRLLPGEYPAGTFLTNLRGTAASPIWLGGIPGETKPIIRDGNQAFHLVRCSYLVVEHLEIADCTGNGINCDDGGDYANPEAAHHLIFRDLHFRNIGTGGNQDALKLSGVYDFFVLDCRFERTSAGGSGIDHVGCHRGVIARCEFNEMGSNSIQCKGGSRDIDIQWNRFINGGSRAVNIGGSTGFQFFRPPLSSDTPNAESSHIRVLANVFLGSDTPVAFVGTVHSLVANNTIVNPSRWPIRILQETVSGDGFVFLPSGQNRFINNLVVFDSSQIRTVVNIGGNTDPASFQFENNLWFAQNQPSQSQPSLPAQESLGLYGQDPLFVNVEEGDYRLKPDSPAIGKGQRLQDVRADFTEHCYAEAPAIGAFEGGSGQPTKMDSDQDGMPDEWEQKNGLNPSDRSDARLDLDGDRMDNYSEYVAGTDPRDASSVLSISSYRHSPSGFSFEFPTSTNRLYQIHVSDLGPSGTWEPRYNLQNSTQAITTFTDPEIHPSRYYQVSVGFVRN